MACRAALKNGDTIQHEQLGGRLPRLGPVPEPALVPLKELPLVGDVRDSHFMMCVEHVQDKPSRTLFDDLRAHRRNCRKHRRVVRPLMHLRVFSPPLTLEEDEIRFLADVMRRGILETADELTREGIPFR